MLNIKSLPFISLIFISSSFLSFFINHFFSEALIYFNGIQSLLALGVMIVLIFILLSTTGVLYLLIEAKERWFTTAIATIGFLVGLNMEGLIVNSFLISLLLTTVFTFGIIFFDNELTTNYRNMIKPNFSLAIQHSAGGFIFFFSIIIALNFYMFNQSQESRDILLQKALAIVIDPVSKFTREDNLKILEALSPDIDAVVGGEDITTSQDIQISEEAANAVKNVFAEQMKQYTAIILNIITIMIFLSLFSVFKLAKILIGPAVSILILLLKSTGYIKEETETVEIVRYKI